MKWPYLVKQKDGRILVDTGTKVTPRRRQLVENEAAAHEVQALWRTEFSLGGKDATLSPKQRLDAVQAIGLLAEKEVNATLSEATAYFLKHRYPHGGDITLQTLAELFVNAKKNARRSNGEPRYSYAYLQSLHIITQLGDDFAGKRLSSILPKDLEAYLHKRKLNDVSRYHYFQYWKMLFNWAVRFRHLEHNPMAQLQSPLLPREDPSILTPQQAKDLAECAFEDHEGVVFPYTVLGLFCGIRPHELRRLKWGDFREGMSVLRISRQVSKTNDIRAIPLPLNLRIMLADYQKRDPDEMVVPMTHNLCRKRFRQVYTRAGLNSWPHDASRHSFASYYLKATNSMPDLISRMGHSKSNMTLKHYVNLTDESWYSYFTITANQSQRSQLQATIAPLWGEQAVKEFSGERQDWSKVLQHLYLK